MKEHLKRKHPVDFENQAEKDVPRKQQKLDVFTRKSSYSTERAAIISNLIAGVIIKDLRPINMVNGAGFQQLMAYLEPAYRLSSDTRFTHLIERMYASVKAEVVKVLSNIDFLSITGDIWTSMATDSYLTLTLHYIDKNWEMQSIFMYSKAA